ERSIGGGHASSPKAEKPRLSELSEASVADDRSALYLKQISDCQSRLAALQENTECTLQLTESRDEMEKLRRENDARRNEIESQKDADAQFRESVEHEHEKLTAQIEALKVEANKRVEREPETPVVAPAAPLKSLAEAPSSDRASLNVRKVQ